jgi:putative copper export protein
MGSYELLLFVHVLAAAAWFGAALLALMLLRRGVAAGDHQWLLQLLEHDDAIAPRLYIPASLVTLASGIALVLTTSWTFRDNWWTTAGLVVFLLVFALGILVLLPATTKLREAASEHGVGSDEVSRQLARLVRASYLDVGLLVVAIVLMTIKPF